uniref:Putative RNA-binding (RRM/RBD/RNP motifs) family protein n=1 Tax=Helianthus annuus TaxID=4232 RepID=A0A251RQ46_HELAN
MMFAISLLFAERLNILILSAGDYACTAYVTFTDAYALETAVLLSGATLLDQTICITKWGQDYDESEYWNRASSWIPEDGNTSYASAQGNQYAFTAGEAVTVAQDVVKTMLAKGYILSKDALGKAKAFDESHQVSASAAAKVAELSERIGLTDRLFAGVEAVRSVDQSYHISDTTKSIMSATGRTAAAAATTVVNSSYFSKGALWMSDALSRAAKAAADLGNNGVGK